MTSESNAAEPAPAAEPQAPPPAAPLDPAPPTTFVPYASPARPAFVKAPVGWTIAAMLTFWPTGIPALLASHRAAVAFGAADHETAQRESSNARRWGIISVIVAAVILVINALLVTAWVFFALIAVHSISDDGGWHGGREWSNEQQRDNPFAPDPQG